MESIYEIELNSDMSSDSSYDSDFEPSGYYQKETSQSSSTVTPEIQTDVYAGNVALMATLSDLLSNVLQKMISAILTEAGANLRDIHCSKSTAFRKMKLTNQYMSAKEEVKSVIEASPYPCITHFDGKTLYEIGAGKKIKIDRLVVFVNIKSETHLIGVPPLPSSSEDQYTGDMEI